MPKFVDEVRIIVRSGHGGPGSVSFRKEKYVEFGGPDGGDGGKGGDVHFISEQALQTLDKYLPLKAYSAGDGIQGHGRNQSGSGGDDLTLKVPVGTQVFDAETGELLFDFLEHAQTFTVARGGRGGKGNAFFKSSTHQVPRFSQPGEEGEEKEILLSLKLLADLGIVGLPNSGKSTLLSKITDAHPKIAGYAFTTLIPNLGVVRRHGDSFRYTVADIPGIIEGASQGHGLGLSFLRHIERVRGILYVFDASSVDIAADFEILKHELEAYNPILLELPSLVVFNKIDVWDDEDYTEELMRKYASISENIIPISALKEINLDLLLDKIDSKIFSLEEE
ncbi:MAG: GTPase ObgE [Leptospiraceae bacterium]|nr:GTPase ObgE [Leptospiraceae bacterium]MCP5499761.1 GTPase ObgE [Leptospiraceae bacterium]